MRIKTALLEYGPCPTCDTMFRSRYKKTFCSLACYVKSPAFKKNTFLGNASRAAQVEIICLLCGVSKSLKKSRSHERFCSKLCARKYYAARFDRWVASPEEIALPQNYDEFLTKDELTCLIAGCDWHGASLGMHMNSTHGITAKEFKKLAGFNTRTGLVNPDFSEKLSSREHLYTQEALERFLKNRQTPVPTEDQKGNSLEAKEHRKKSRAVRVSTPQNINLTCPGCGTKFSYLWDGITPRKYCSIECRTKISRSRSVEKKFPLTCSLCNSSFHGNTQQKNRNRHGYPVACSNQCKGKLNVSKRISRPKDG